MAFSKTFPLMLIVWASAIQPVAASGDDFLDKIFTYLAPILTLIGEKPVLQFLGHTTGLTHAMIISTLPIGLGPLMLSAIRVAGPRWLKAFVGRLKESRATAEMDILTSTSEEVCDVWNGHAMVRVAGRSRTKQVLCIRDESKNCEGLVNVSRYLYDGPNDPHEIGGYYAYAHHFRIHEDVHNVILIAPDAQDENHVSPCISINNYEPHRYEAVVCSWFGVAVQVSIIAWSAISQYYFRLPKKDNDPVASYASATFISGVVLLWAGSFMATMIVEWSTLESTYKLRDKRAGRLIWLQPEGAVGDQQLDSYALASGENATSFTVSRRLTEADEKGVRSHLGWMTVISTCLILAGYGPFFIGLIQLHWSVSALQVGLSVIMQCLRAWIGRGYQRQPQSKAIQPGLESEWLARRLAGGMRSSFYLDEDEPPLEDRGPPGTRDAIFCFLKFFIGTIHWETGARLESVKLQHALETTLHHSIKTGRSSNISWFPHTLSKDITCRVHTNGDTWNVPLTDVEAALSTITYASQKGRPMRIDTSPPIRLLGQYSEQLYKDMSFWLVNEPGHLLTVQGNGGGVQVRTPNQIVLGPVPASNLAEVFNMGSYHMLYHSIIPLSDLDEHHQRVKDMENVTECMAFATESTDSLVNIHALNILSSFVETLPLEDLHNMGPSLDAAIHSGENVPPSHLTKNDALLQLVSDVRETGLGSMKDAFGALTPPLSSKGKLVVQVDDLVASVIKAGRPLEIRGDFIAAGSLYVWMAKVLRAVSCSYSAKIKCLAMIDGHKKDVKNLIERSKQESVQNDFLDDLKTHLRRVEDLERSSTGRAAYESTVHPLLHYMETSKPLDMGDYDFGGCEWTELHKAVARADQEAFQQLLSKPERPGENQEEDRKRAVNVDDVLGRTPLHYAAAGLGQPAEAYAELQIRSLLQVGANRHAQDMVGNTPLHWACVHGPPAAVRVLISAGINPDSAAFDGSTPLHCMARVREVSHPREKIYELMSGGASINKRDAGGGTPLLLAVMHGNVGTFEVLWELSDRTAKNSAGRNSLQLAALTGNGHIFHICWRMSYFRPIDRHGKTLLHLAIIGGNTKIVDSLLREGAEKDGEKYPLHLAVRVGHGAMVRMLAGRNRSWINMQDGLGRTPLHEVVSVPQSDDKTDAMDTKAPGVENDPAEDRQRQMSVVRALLELGCRTDVRDFVGQTPGELANSNGYQSQELLDLLSAV